MISVPYETGSAFAAAMDARDPLARFRERFYIPKTKTGPIAFICAGTRLVCSPRLSGHILSRNCTIGRTLASKDIFMQRLRGCLITGC